MWGSINLLYLWRKIWKSHAKGKKYPKFGYYYHYTSEYRGATYSICNLKHIPKEITITFSQWINLRLSLHYKWDSRNNWRIIYLFIK